MSLKIGRPKADNPKEVKVSIRFDRDTDKWLTEYCVLNKISKGEAVRRGIHLLMNKKEK